MYKVKYYFIKPVISNNSTSMAIIYFVYFECKLCVNITYWTNLTVSQLIIKLITRV